MSSPGPLALDHNPFADDHDHEDTTHRPSVSHDVDEDQTGPTIGPVSHSDLAGFQQQQWNDQDQHLDALTLSLNRQHEMSLQMNEELDLHQELLEEFDGDAERTGLRLGGASNQLDRLRNTLRDHGE